MGETITDRYKPPFKYTQGFKFDSPCRIYDKNEKFVAGCNNSEVAQLIISALNQYADPKDLEAM